MKLGDHEHPLQFVTIIPLGFHETMKIKLNLGFLIHHRHSLTTTKNGPELGIAQKIDQMLLGDSTSIEKIPLQEMTVSNEQCYP